ncbi:MAG: hypothetical protein VW362_01320 [Candidatus Nanopelagicales bacterium]
MSYRPIVWFRVIADLEQRGLTLRSQADAVGVSVGAVYYWKQGGEPKHAHGERLLALYMDTLRIQPPRATLAST